jgi:hypothetical protein
MPSAVWWGGCPGLPFCSRRQAVIRCHSIMHEPALPEVVMSHRWQKALTVVFSVQKSTLMHNEMAVWGPAARMHYLRLLVCFWSQKKSSCWMKLIVVMIAYVCPSNILCHAILVESYSTNRVHSTSATALCSLPAQRQEKETKDCMHASSTRNMCNASKKP